MLRNFEYRLYPTKKQEARLYSVFHNRAGLARIHARGDDVRPWIEKAVVAEAGTICSARG